MRTSQHDDDFHGPETSFQWRSERYVRSLLDRLGIDTLQGMKEVVEALRADTDRPESVNDLKRIAERFLSGREAPLRIVSEEEIEAFIQAHIRVAAVASVHESDGKDVKASRFHGVPCLPTGIEWPRSREGTPLMFLGQFDLNEAGVRPAAVERAGYLSVFVEQADEDDRIEDCGEIVVIEAESRSHVSPCQVPDGVIIRDPVWLKFRTITSLPSLDDPYVALPAGMSHEDSWRSNLAEAVQLRSEETNYETMIGGWTHQVQMNFPCLMMDAGPGARYPMVLQVGEEHGLEYGDGGYLYIAKGLQTYDDGNGGYKGVLGWTTEIQTF